MKAREGDYEAAHLPLEIQIRRMFGLRRKQSERTTRTLKGSFVVALLMGIGPTSVALGDYAPATRIELDDRAVQSFRLGLDFFQNVLLAYETEGELLVDLRTESGTSRSSVGPGREPSMAFHPVGVVLAFSGPDSPGALNGDPTRIRLASRSGAQWSAPKNVSAPPGSDRRPSLQIGSDSRAVIAWEKQAESGESSIWLYREGIGAVEVGRGEQPTLVLDGVGRAHIFFLRDGDIAYTRERSSADPGQMIAPELLTETPDVTESKPSVALAPNQVLHACFARDGNILLTNNARGTFGEPFVFFDGNASRPSIAISPAGAMAIAFESGGDIHAGLGTTFLIPGTVPVTETPEVESSPQVIVDSFANVHVAYLSEGDLYYTTNAGTPQARFTAEPLSGEAPLDVRFRDRSSGSVTGWLWDFGDGATSTDENPTHRFLETGQFQVTLRVTGPGGESPIEARETLSVLDPSNTIHVGGVRVFPGQRDVNIPIVTTHDQPAQGFTIVGVYDPSMLTVKNVVFEGTNIEGLAPELFVPKISEDPAEPYFAVGILFDVVQPIDGRELLPGRGLRIVNVVVDVSPNARPGSSTRISLENRIGRPPLSNIITVDGHSVFPVIRNDGLVEIAHLRFPPPGFFVRADANDDGSVNITDAVTVLRHLFSGEAPPPCSDAADANDDGQIDITDAVFTLNFLFRSAGYPTSPYPDAGLDPTDDSLPPCLLR